MICTGILDLYKCPSIKRDLKNIFLRCIKPHRTKPNLYYIYLYFFPFWYPIKLQHFNISTEAHFVLAF